MRGRKIKFGVRVHQADYSYEDLVRIWTAADALGYHSATLYDLLSVPALECWTTLAALAAETRSIRLTPLVLANTYRHPSLLAKMGATLDVISGGRLELGIGAGGGGVDHLAYGFSFLNPIQRVEMLEEAVQTIKMLWTQEEATFKGQGQGRHYTLEGAICQPKPLQKPHPPLLIDGHGERHLLRSVARYGDICNIGFEMSPAQHLAKLKVLEEHCDAVGRDPSEIEVSHNTRVVIGATGREFEEMVAAGAARSGMTVGGYRDTLGGAIAGTPDQCVAQLQPLMDMGITYFFLLFPDPIESASLELFAKEVMVRFT